MLHQQAIDKAKHIVIVLEENPTIGHLGCASALYTYVLQLHKKVSLYCPKSNFGLELHFLPWIEKVKPSYPSSSDYEIAKYNLFEVYEFFQVNKININAKMATSLYAALLEHTQGFRRALDGIVFALAKELVEKNADIALCTANILAHQSLASLRLKALLLSKMVLTEGASNALFELSDEDLKQSGAKVEDARACLQEALSLPTVDLAILKYNNKIVMKEVIN